MMLYKNTKVKVYSPDGNTDFFDIVACVLQADTFALQPVHNLPKLRASNIDRFNERKWLTLEKSRNRRYPAQSFTYEDYADDIALLANTPTQTESLLHNLQKAGGGIGLRVNADKTEYTSFNHNQTGDTSALTGGSLKLVDKFTYLGTSVSSTENDINMCLAKAGSAIDRLSVIWISDLTDIIIQFFFKQQSYPYYCMDAPHGR